MHARCRRWIANILRAHSSLVALAVRQRAKFEGWLKLELAECARKRGARSVQVEPQLGKGKGRADVSFAFGKLRYNVELKTVNTNWEVPGVESKTRPITMNIASVIEGARKLRTGPGRGIVAFVLFPVPTGDNRWWVYVERIARSLRVRLSQSSHCARVGVRLGGGDSCDLVVCCFPYPGGARDETEN